LFKKRLQNQINRKSTKKFSNIKEKNRKSFIVLWFDSFIARGATAYQTIRLSNYQTKFACKPICQRTCFYRV